MTEKCDLGWNRGFVEICCCKSKKYLLFVWTVLSLTEIVRLNIEKGNQ